jgi:hypothetical protein
LFSAAKRGGANIEAVCLDVSQGECETSVPPHTHVLVYPNIQHPRRHDVLKDSVQADLGAVADQHAAAAELRVRPLLQLALLGPLEGEVDVQS